MQLTEIIKLINNSKHIAVMGHKGGDADSYGSAFALASALEKMNKNVRVVTGEDFPDSLNFLFFYFTGEIVREIESVDLLIVLDTSNLDKTTSPKLAEKLKANGAKVVQLDHHTLGDMKQFADFTATYEGACSTSEIVYNLLMEMNLEIDKNVATCLLAGIVGDTSSFQNQNTTGECFAIASELMKRGARQRAITNHLFGGREVDALKIWGLAMERLTENKKFGIVSTYLLHEEIERFGLSLDVLSGIVNYLNSIKGAKIVMLITEEEKGTIKVSMRTRDEHANVAIIAKQLGGGGHIKAAGFSFPGSLKI